MQLGMIGLGLMDAHMVRWLIHNGRSRVLFDSSPPGVGELVKDKATGTASLAELAKQLAKPRALWRMAPVAVVDETIAELVPHLETGDILIDGSNPSYVDDIRRARNSLRGRSIMWMYAEEQTRVPTTR